MPQPRSTLTRCNAVHTAFPNSQLAQPFATRRWFNHSPALPRTRAAPCPQPARAGAAVTHSAVVGPSRCRGAYGSSFAAVGCTILDQSRDACVFHVPPQRAAGTASPAAGSPTCHECFRERAACGRASARAPICLIGVPRARTNRRAADNAPTRLDLLGHAGGTRRSEVGHVATAPRVQVRTRFCREHKLERAPLVPSPFHII